MYKTCCGENFFYRIYASVGSGIYVVGISMRLWGLSTILLGHPIGLDDDEQSSRPHVCMNINDALYGECLFVLMIMWFSKNSYIQNSSLPELMFN